MIFYLPEIWSSISPYLVQSRYQASSLYSFHNIGSPWLPLSHMFANFRMLYYREGPDISTPSHGGTNPTLDSCHPTTYHRRSHVWCPQSIPPVNGSDIISWSKETILGIYKALAIKLSDTINCKLYYWVCPSHHSPNDMTTLSSDYNKSMVRKP